MKTNIYKCMILLAAMALMAASCSKSSDSGLNFTGEEGSPNAANPSLVEDRLALEAGLKKIVYHVGPVDVPQGLKAEDMAKKPIVMNFQTDEAVWVVGFAPRVVDSKGTKLPAELLHLAVIKNMHEDSPFCSDAGSGNPFVAANSMLTEVNLPQGYGYPVLSTDPLEAMVVLKNDTETAYVDAYFEVVLLVRPMGELAELKDVKPLFVEMEPCDHSAAEVAPGKFTEFGSTYQVPMSGSVVTAHGILGDFGTSVELTSGGKATPFWRAEATLDEDHRIVSLSDNPFESTDEISFKEGEEINLTVSYDNVSDSWINGAAAAMVYFAPKN